MAGVAVRGSSFFWKEAQGLLTVDVGVRDIRLTGDVGNHVAFKIVQTIIV